MEENAQTNPADASNTPPAAPVPTPFQQSAPFNPENETELERSQHGLNTNTAPHSGEIGNDIAKILQDVKLPERREMRASADVKIAPQETVIPAVAPAPSEQVVEEKPSIVTPLRTLKDDLQRILRTRRITTVRAVALEQEKKRQAPPKLPVEIERSRRRARQSAGLIFAIIGLFILGGAALFGVYFISNERAEAPSVPVSSILFAESTVSLPIANQSPDALKQLIASAEGTQEGAVGSIVRIVPMLSASSTTSSGTPQSATVQQFFTALGMQPPQDLYRALGTSFFFGLYNAGGETPLFVIPVVSYEQAFADMLAWEPTMDQDLAPVFPSVPVLTTGSDGLPTTRTFQDDVMRNYDVRELKDDSNNIVLYYSFPTPGILVIASSPYTFNEVLNRLQAAREL